MRKLAYLAATLVMVFTLAGCGEDNTQTNTVTVVSGVDRKLVQALADRYNTMPGVKTKVQVADPKKGEEADMVLEGSGQLKKLASEGQLQAAGSVYGDLVPLDLKDPQDLWLGLFYDPAVILVNHAYSRRLGQENLQHWDDLKKLKEARLVMENLTDSDSTRMFLACMASRMGQDQFLDYFRGIRHLILQYAKFPITPVRMTATGDADIALTRRSYVFKYLQDDFPAYILIPGEGTPVNLYGAGIRKATKKQEACRNFINWMLHDPEARNVLLSQKCGYLPVLPRGEKGKAVDSGKLWTNTFYKDDAALDGLSQTWLSQIRLTQTNAEEERK